MSFSTVYYGAGTNGLQVFSTLRRTKDETMKSQNADSGDPASFADEMGLLAGLLKSNPHHTSFPTVQEWRPNSSFKPRGD